MLWLGRHLVVIAILVCLIVGSPMLIKKLFDTSDCVGQMRTAGWPERLLVLARVRDCPSPPR